VVRSPSKRPNRPASLPGDDIFDNRQDSFLIPQGELDLFHYMVNHIGDEVIVLDKNARIVFVNDAAVRGMGYSIKRILHRPIIDFLLKKISVKEWQRRWFTDVKKKQKPISYVIDRVGKGRRVQTIEVSAVYMLYKGKEYVLTVGRDITEQLAFQAKLKESEDRYRLLSEQAAEGILMFDPKGVILYANKAVEQMFGRSVSFLVGTRVQQYMDKPSLVKAKECLQKVGKGTTSVCSDIHIKNKTGRLIPVEFTGSPILENKKVVRIHAIVRDVSQRKEVEHLVRESEKMEALQHFIAGTIHEIQQPLRGLLDHSLYLMTKYKDRPFEYIGHKEFSDIMKMLQTMHNQTKYCFDTTERLISLNQQKIKLEGGHNSVNTAIRESARMLKHSLEVNDVKLVKKLSSNLPPVAINSLDLCQVFDSILTNAIQSLPGGGGGTIQIKTTYQKAAGMVRIDCQDDGVGIPKEVLDRVFEPFFTTKPRGLEKSSGLGLSIVYSIVKANQGNISIKSKFRQGTLVKILLPICKKGTS